MTKTINIGSIILVVIITLLLVQIHTTYAANSNIWIPLTLSSFEQANVGMPGGEGMQKVYDITYAPSNPDIAYFVSDTSGVWRGTWEENLGDWNRDGYLDSGFFWVSKRGSAENGFKAFGGISLVVDPVNEDVVFVTGSRHNDSATYDSLINGIYMTTDGGDNWHLAYQTKYLRRAEGEHFVFDPRESTVGCDLAGGKCQHKTIYAGTHFDGLLKSTNGGVTFEPVRDIEGTIILYGSRIFDLELHVVGLDILLYAATEDGLVKIIDDGYNGISVSKLGCLNSGYIKCSGAEPDLTSYARTIAVDPQIHNIVYAAVGKHKVYRSIDGGLSFEQISTNLPDVQGSKEYKVIDISNANPDQLYVYIHSLYDRQPYYTNDGGETWHKPDGIDEGNFSMRAGNASTSGTASHPSDSNIALRYFGAVDRIALTTNGGRTWKYSGNGYIGGRRNVNKTSAFFGEVGVIPDERVTVFFLTDYGPVRTDDNSLSWKMLINDPVNSTTNVGALDPDNSDVIITARGGWNSQRLARSIDGGSNWEYYDNTWDNYKMITYHPQDPDFIYAGAYNSSWISNDDGFSWTHIDKSIRAVFPNKDNTGPNNIVYAFTAKDGINDPADCRYNYESILWRGELHNPQDDPFITWEAVNCIGIGMSGINDVDIDPVEPNRLYAAGPNGFWVYDECDGIHDLDCTINGLGNNDWVKKNTGINGECYTESCSNAINVMSVAVDPNDANIVYAGLTSSYGHRTEPIYRSDNKGDNWNSIDYGFLVNTIAHSLTVDHSNSILHISTSHGNYVLCTDSDGDGDAVEGGMCGIKDLDDNDPSLNSGDIDGDGLDNFFEVEIGTDRFNPDTDGDQITDYEEVCYDWDCSTYKPYPLGDDLNALHADTDLDGIADGAETEQAGDPLDIFSPAPDGWKLSRNSDFSTSDTVFSVTDTIYILVWTDRIDANNIRNAEYRIKERSKTVIEGPFNAGHILSTYKAQIGGSTLSPGEKNLKINIIDYAQEKYRETISMEIR